MTDEYNKQSYEIFKAKKKYLASKSIVDLKIFRKEKRKIFRITNTAITSGREINFARYEDEFLIGIKGTRKFAEEIKTKINEFLKNSLLIELNQEKTKITNINNKLITFLGYNIGAADRYYYESLRSKVESTNVIRRPGLGAIFLYIPRMKILNKLRTLGFAHLTKEQGKYYGPWINLDVEEIIIRYRSLIMNIRNYYLLARQQSRVQFIDYLLRFSAAHTLAAKFKTSICKIFKKYGKYLNIRLNNNKILNLNYEIPFRTYDKTNKNEPLKVLNYNVKSKFLLEKVCIICGSDNDVEMHHIRHLKDLNPKLSAAKALKAKVQRKQIPVCKKCHMDIHYGRYNGPSLKKF